MSRPTISLTISAPAGATLPDILRDMGSPTTAPGYDVTHLSVELGGHEGVYSDGYRRVPLELLPAPLVQAPAPEPEPAAQTKSQVKRTRAQKGEAPPEPASVANTPVLDPADDPGAGADPAPPAEPEAPAEPGITVDELRDAARGLISAKRGQAVHKILAQFNADSISDVLVEKRADCLSALQLALVE